MAVAADAPGVSRRPYRVTDGSFAAEIELHDAPGERLAVDTTAFTDAVALARLLAAAEMLGLGQRAFDETVAYVRQREQFGVPIGSFQALQHRLVDCYAALEQVRSLVWRTALEGARGLASPAAAGVKAFAGEAMRRVIEEAVQMHGGMGQTHELAVGHALKRLMLLDRLFGDPDHCLAEYANAA
jgi:alkylation response protein AidB-like acyl-CoA dehydrogenase